MGSDVQEPQATCMEAVHGARQHRPPLAEDSPALERLGELAQGSADVGLDSRAEVGIPRALGVDGLEAREHAPQQDRDTRPRLHPADLHGQRCLDGAAAFVSSTRNSGVRRCAPAYWRLPSTLADMLWRATYTMKRSPKP
jgi:hypothetical protein